jgi:hypothetical protein
MKKIFFLFGLGLALLVVGCVKVETQEPSFVIFTSTLNEANEETSTGSSATGFASAVYYQDTKILNVTVSYTGITPIAGHIHVGPVKVSGPIVFTFTSLTSPFDFTSAPLDAAQESSLLANLYYINLHTAAFPDGEIRGQLIKN